MKINATILLVLSLLGAAVSSGQVRSAKLIKTTTALSSSLNPSPYGAAVTFTATVTPAPPDGETITFSQGKNALGTGTLSGGTATYMTSQLLPGSYRIEALYPGDGTYGASSRTLQQTVNEIPTTTALVSSQNPINFGQRVTFTATVSADSGTPTGNIAFYNGTGKLGTATLSGGVANFSTTKLPAGTDSITALYKGNSLFASSTSNTVSETVTGGCGVGTPTDFSMIWPLGTSTLRYYEVYSPANLPPNSPMLLMLHGTRTTPATGSDPTPIITLDWGWQPIADENCFLLVKPASTYDPTNNAWNWNAYCMDGSPEICASFGWNGGAFSYAEGCGSDDNECPDDVGFLGALIQNLTSQYTVNPNQVYVAGFSSGGQMAERVGVELSNLVAAIIPGSGQLEGQQSAPPPLFTPTPALYGFQPISAQEWHGTEDTNLWPCSYGTTKYNGVTFYLDTVDDTFNFWTGSLTNSCTTFATAQPLCLNGQPNNANDAPMLGIPGLTGNDATGCANNVEVQFIWMPDVEHSWQQQYNAQRWAFFAAHPKQPQPKLARKTIHQPPRGTPPSPVEMQ